MRDNTEYAGQVLDEARTAFSAEDYPLALEKYEWFFEHALDEDDASYYGVRLSYCLSEWTILASVFPPAQAKLEALCLSSLTKFLSTGDPELFHDYLTIAEYLGRTSEALEQFISLHGSNPPLAKAVVRFIWKELIKSKLWEICGAYVENSMEVYSNAIRKYEQAMAVKIANPDLGGQEFADQICSWYEHEVTNLISVLNRTARTIESAEICNLANADIEKHKIAVSKFSL